MALKKDFPSGTKFYYLAIGGITLAKNNAESQGQEHKLELNLWIKDSSDLEFSQLENTIEYHIPLVDPYNVDRIDPFDLAKQEPLGANVRQLAYEEVKAKMPLFAEFVDC
ncbi:MAG: hypothetical protein QNL04_10845 [SAR324 cluster bacterium]|nr:hypothetical protein [SAR324 cluster bacterium]